MIAGWKRVLLPALLAAFSLCPQISTACGPEFETAIFTGVRNPDAPLDAYLQGRLGILQPAFARSYLYVAYRALSGAALSEEGCDAALQLINDRIWADYHLYDSEIKAESDSSPVVREWVEARSKLDGQGKEPDTLKESGYLSFRNCLEDSFSNAAATLRARVERFGATSREVAEWVRGQDLVFANCSKGENVPGALPEGIDPLIARDRAYQIAAAHFYAGNFDKAAELFLAIAEDGASPWKEIAPYLAGRALLRKARSLDDGRESAGERQEQRESEVKDAYARAAGQFRAVLGRAELTRWHPAAQKMLNLIRFRIDPAERRKELARLLLAPSQGTVPIQELGDYLWLLDEFSERNLGEPFPYPEGTSAEGSSNKDKIRELPDKLKQEGDLTDWIFTFQYDSPELLDHALEKYRTTRSLPWLVASLSKIRPENAGFHEVLEGATKVLKDSPGYLSVGYHVARCLFLAGKTDEARGRADELLALPADQVPQSSRNLLLALRMRVARNLDEFLRDAQRVPARYSFSRDYPYAKIEVPPGPDESGEGARLQKLIHGRALFDADAALALNGMFPLLLLAKTARSEVLPEHLRLPLARSAWVRSVLLDREDTAMELAAYLKDREPVLQPHLSAYLNAKGREARKTMAILAILRVPGLRPYLETGLGRLTPLDRINNYRDNWWCSLDCQKSTAGDFPFLQNDFCQESAGLARNLTMLYPGGRVDAPGFFGAAERDAASKERAALASIGPAPDYLSAFAIAWAKREESNPAVPEALHLAVRSTRYGCTDSETTKYSKSAFEILGKKYPRSPWKTKTPYWY